MKEKKDGILPTNNDPIKFWKNFRLGTELHISGSLIYNALHSFDQIEYFYYEHDVFEFLYSLSIGLERLEKIVVILTEHDEEIDQEEFEKTLITHNHLELLKRIKKKHTINLGKQHVKLLQFISDFYRYAIVGITSNQFMKKIKIYMDS